jgi:hypothetical protein
MEDPPHHALVQGGLKVKWSEISAEEITMRKSCCLAHEL